MQARFAMRGPPGTHADRPRTPFLMTTLCALVVLAPKKAGPALGGKGLLDSSMREKKRWTKQCASDCFSVCPPRSKMTFSAYAGHRWHGWKGRVR